MPEPVRFRPCDRLSALGRKVEAAAGVSDPAVVAHPTDVPTDVPDWAACAAAAWRRPSQPSQPV
ncbi:hypothetical protein MCBMB27_01105 [Methylobacterium phyllosphaerae]|uniref:Uncharacterized protein n=1 Tax=Methylobacterium phyllosphaerae TaxID=418223 RepID=A0AAE8L5A9_9HYPH|nr:hypothetical protein MCBMB27_01105 [Methylobacterium phyllosphaerae]SFG48810.1 hypothetical protein SAMN05192567_10454 [Methylobacterium phyllosphaerae]